MGDPGAAMTRADEAAKEATRADLENFVSECEEKERRGTGGRMDAFKVSKRCADRVGAYKHCWMICDEKLE